MFRFSGTKNENHISGADPEYALKVSLLSSDRQSVIQQKEVLSNVEDWDDKWKKVNNMTDIVKLKIPFMKFTIFETRFIF